MGVSGFTRPPERCEGGLSDVWLAAADDIVACTYNGATGTFGAVRLREGAAFARYEFAEDTARYRQYVSGDAPACVVHELSFALRRADAGSTVALASLLGATGGGFVAWSPGFGGERPLRLVSAVFDTQAGYDEDSGAVVVLRSEDTSFSKPFAGTLPE